MNPRQKLKRGNGFYPWMTDVDWQIERSFAVQLLKRYGAFWGGKR